MEAGRSRLPITPPRILGPAVGVGVFLFPGHNRNEECRIFGEFTRPGIGARDRSGNVASFAAISARKEGRQDWRRCVCDPPSPRLFPVNRWALTGPYSRAPYRGEETLIFASIRGDPGLRCEMEPKWEIAWITHRVVAILNSTLIWILVAWSGAVSSPSPLSTLPCFPYRRATRDFRGASIIYVSINHSYMLVI